ncbi:sigma intracellular receptor 2-like [Coffea eugenioides]|uniref:sigma intracellular receptor 2-like n=1 Tax=Coffea eugenioides TaxID=49369 RepID=UPI000F6064FC|nr:sigma intracellular receptor 2-like [Coffea eugenioides]
MGSLTKLIDVLLFLYFLFIALTAPVTDALTIFPSNLLPTFLLDLKKWYIKEFDDYLFAEKPHFFVGLTWVELLFQWPVAVLCVYGLAGSKSWFNITSLVYGASSLTGLIAIQAELIGSKRASTKPILIYLLPLLVAVLAILRGVLLYSGKSSPIGKRPALNQKRIAKNH